MIFCDATQRIYNRVPRTRKVYAKSRKNPGGKEDEDKPDTLPPDVSTDDPNSRGDTPRAAIDGLDDQTDNADLYLSKFDGFFRMLEVLEQEHGVEQNKPIIRKLPAVGRSKNHLMADWSPRCMAIVRIEHQTEGYYLLEVDTSDSRASIATKVISVQAIATQGQLQDFVSEIEQGLLSNQFSWPKKYLDVLVGESSHKSVPHQQSVRDGQLNNREVISWAIRFNSVLERLKQLN